MASEKRHRVVVYVNEELKLRAEKKSDQLGLSLSGLFNVAISDYLKQDTVIEMAEMFKALQVNEKFQSMVESGQDNDLEK